MPVITGGSGHASLGDNQFTLVVSQGGVTAETGDRLDASGSVFHVPDTREKPSSAEISIRASGPLTAGLSILSNPPVRLLERANRPLDMAVGQAHIQAQVDLPLQGNLTPDLVNYSVEAVVTDARSEVLVANRILEADSARIAIVNQQVQISGDMRLDGVPLSAAWERVAGSEPGSRVTGTVALGADTVDAFDLPLPAGMISGRGRGQYSIDMKAGQAPKLTLTSDLAGVGLSLAGLGWTKSPDARADLKLEAELGTVPNVSVLALSAPGLDLNGRLLFGEDGQFRQAAFDRVRVGNWLDGGARLSPRAGGRPPAIALRGGTLDLRALPRQRGGQSSRGPIELSLDTLIVSDSLRLSQVSGKIDAGQGGLSGVFEARLNGQTAVRGTVVPANAGTAVRVQTADAGGVLRDAGLTPNANGGTMDLVLTPIVGAPSGTYDGQFLIEGMRLRNAPVMADLLDAISVVGLLNQLSGPGIHFDTIDGSFRLSPDRLFLSEAAAIGASMGISAEGAYDLASKNMDFAGVVSPVYFLNGIGSIVSRRGEGLFGFNYRVTGSTEDPKVGVNPLSILTPGIFRDIFRRSPPTE
jgi:hypothetical protein